MIKNERMTIVHQAEIAHNIYELTVKGELVQEMTPGQFVHVKVGDSFEPLLRRPISIANINKETNEFFTYFREQIPAKYHGTGDVFASTLVGAMENDKTLEEALKIAVDYVWETINDTYKEKKEDAYGVNFENKMPYLIDRLKTRDIPRL